MIVSSNVFEKFYTRGGDVSGLYLAVPLIIFVVVVGLFLLNILFNIFANAMLYQTDKRATGYP